MAFIGSDTFSLATNGLTIAGVNLDNALGGSTPGPWAQDVSGPWIKQAAGTYSGDTSGTVVGTNANSNAYADFGEAVVVATMRFRFDGGTANLGVMLNALDYDDCVLCFYVASNNTLRIRQLVGGASTDQDSEALSGALTTGVWYRLVASVDASGNYSAEITDDSGVSLMNVGPATWPSGAAPTRESHGFRNFSTTANRSIVDWITVETNDGGGGGGGDQIYGGWWIEA
jgi:hypothetical protein